MKVKTFLIRALKILSILLAIFFFISLSQKYIVRYNNRDSLRVDGFRMEEKDSLDVVLLGSSEIYSAFSSAYAYDLCGFTSYPYAVAAGPVTLWKTMLEETLSRQTPQLIVVEINGVVYDKPASLHSNAAMHYILDSMPLSKNKIETINRLCDSNTDSKSCFYFPIIKYHSGWQDIENLGANYANMRQMQKRGHTLLRGVSSTPVIDPVRNGVRDLTDDYSQRPLAKEAEQYLREFLEYCRQKDLNVLFVRFPHRISSSDNDPIYRCFQVTNMAGEIIEEYGYSFINLERNAAEIGLDPEQDFYNSNHLNIFGQRKFTKYFSQYLVDNYGVTPGEHSKDLSAGWDESAEYYQLYCQYVEERMNSGSSSAIAETAGLVSRLNEIKAQKTGGTDA